MTFFWDHIARPKYHACYYRPSCPYCWLRVVLVILAAQLQRRLR